MKRAQRNKQKRNWNSILFPILTVVGIGVIAVISSLYEPSWSYNWNGIRQTIRDSVKVAEFDGVVMNSLDYNGRKSKQYHRQHWIMENANESELLKLAKYPNGTIKAIAYEGLLRNDISKSKTDLVLQSFRDIKYPVYYDFGNQIIATLWQDPKLV